MRLKQEQNFRCSLGLSRVAPSEAEASKWLMAERNPMAWFSPSHPVCALHAAATKLYFLFCQELQQMAALFGGCGLGLFERVYCSARAIGTETETKGEKRNFTSGTSMKERWDQPCFLCGCIVTKRAVKDIDTCIINTVTPFHLRVKWNMAQLSSLCVDPCNTWRGGALKIFLLGGVHGRIPPFLKSSQNKGLAHTCVSSVSFALICCLMMPLFFFMICIPCLSRGDFMRNTYINLQPF